MTDMVNPPWQDLGLPRVINAAGKMTYLGSSAVTSGVADAMARGARSFVEMSRLKAEAGRHAATQIGVPAACVVASAAAGITQAVAATITGENIPLIEQVPLVESPRRTIVIQKAHAIHFGAPLIQMIGLGGGLVREIGSANRCTPAHLVQALDENTAAVVYAVTHHVQAESSIEVDEMIQLAHARDVPVIVDAAAETDLRKYVELGADLVVYSGHKAIGAPTSGLVVGAPHLVAACSAQEAGVGRAMKVSKEAIAGLLRALEEYVSGATSVTPDQLVDRLKAVVDACGKDVPAALTVVWDATRPIPRLEVRLAATAPLAARELVTALEHADPSVRTRNHDAEHGSIAIDPRELSIEDATRVGQALRKHLMEAAP